MLFDHVDQDDRLGLKRVFEMRIALGHAPGEVGREGEDGAVTTAQLIQRQFFKITGFLFCDTTNRSGCSSILG